MKICETICFWLKAARGHTMPMSIMSWLVPFLVSFKMGGNVFYGVLALIGIMSAHLGVNLIDDYFDYKREVGTIKSSDEKKSIKMQKGKCAYLLGERATLNQTLFVSLCFFALAALIGLFFFLKCGWMVIWIALAAGIMGLLYPFLTYFGLSELAVGLSFGPLLYAGVSFVMLSYIPSFILLLSISTGLLTVGLLHTHALMDYDFDLKDNKKTLCVLLGSKQNALFALGVMMSAAYLNILFWSFKEVFPSSYMLVFLMVYLPVALYHFMQISITQPDRIIQKEAWMGPMENWDEIVKGNAQNFMLRFYLSRNVMVFFTLLLCVGILISDKFLY